MSDSLQPHRLQSSRLLCPWDSPDKNTGVGCHSLLQGNTLSRFVVLSLPRRKHLLISWLKRSLLNNWPYLLRLFQETRQKSMFTYFLAACLLSCHCNCENQKEVATRNGSFSCFFFFSFNTRVSTHSHKFHFLRAHFQASASQITALLSSENQATCLTGGSSFFAE